MSKKINKKGFTLIEVVLVIAIGALIFLLAFIAFGNAQTNRKDSQRRTALDTIAAEIENYKSDRNGAVPNSGADLKPYVSELKTPEKTTYNVEATSVTAATAIPGDVVYTRYTADAASCSDVSPAKSIKATSASPGWKIEMKLQKGIACRDSTSS